MDIKTSSWLTPSEVISAQVEDGVKVWVWDSHLDTIDGGVIITTGHTLIFCEILKDRECRQEFYCSKDDNRYMLCRAMVPLKPTLKDNK